MLSIPTIRDRVVQGALKLILEPIFGADFQPGPFGYRPRKSAHDAVGRVRPESLQRKTVSSPSMRSIACWSEPVRSPAMRDGQRSSMSALRTIWPDQRPLRNSPGSERIEEESGVSVGVRKGRMSHSLSGPKRGGDRLISRASE